MGCRSSTSPTSTSPAGLARRISRRSSSQTNQRQPDLVAITGDLVDRTDLIDWIPETLGRLRARYGVYYVLGNHDRRVDCAGSGRRSTVAA